jgi:hypothetical protein
MSNPNAQGASGYIHLCCDHRRSILVKWHNMWRAVKESFRWGHRTWDATATTREEIVDPGAKQGGSVMKRGEVQAHHIFERDLFGVRRV